MLLFSQTLIFFINTQFSTHPCLSTSYETNFCCPVTPHEHYSYILSVCMCRSTSYVCNTNSTQTLCGRWDRILYGTFINYYLLLNDIKVVFYLNKQLWIETEPLETSSNFCFTYFSINFFCCFAHKNPGKFFFCKFSIWVLASSF